MKKVLLGIVIGAFAFHAYQRVNNPARAGIPSIGGGSTGQPAREDGQ
jgi:hypothetical protein